MTKTHFLILLFIIAIPLVPLVYADGQAPPRTTKTQLLYMNKDTHTVNGVLAYVLNTTQEQSSQTVQLDKISKSVQTCYWAWRIYITDASNGSVELTSGTPTASVNRGTNSFGVQSATWQPTSTLMNSGKIGNTAIKMELYMRYGSDAWTKKATFSTVQFDMAKITNATWTIYSYTQYTRTFNGTHYTHACNYYFGTTTYNSRVSNVQFEEPYHWEKMYDHLRDGNLFLFFLEPYLYLLGSITYGLLGLFVFYPIYKRTSITVVLIVIILLGGFSGAILTQIVPAAGFQIGMVIAILALAALLYKTVKGLARD